MITISLLLFIYGTLHYLVKKLYNLSINYDFDEGHNSSKKDFLITSQNNNLKKESNSTHQTIDELVDLTHKTKIFSENKNFTKQKSFILLLQKEYPQLSNTNIKHCFFVHIGLSQKETAQILNISVNTVKNARYRAKSKLDIDLTNKNISFKDYLAHIENKLLSSISTKKLNVLGSHPYARLN